ncbi:MAG: ORF6N domain-containing protein [Elusimicrobiota bacterium]|jgi:phage regulator Rha-like protein
MNELVFMDDIPQRIFWIRGRRVMLDSHLAELYEVPTFRLNEQVKRNRRRFPDDFMFQLNNEEIELLRSQFAILKTGSRGEHRKYLPYAFTEQGVAMLSSVLNSERAIAVNIAIMRAFVRMREILATHKDLLRRIENIEEQMAKHGNIFEEQTKDIQTIFQAIQALLKKGEPVDQNVLAPVGFKRKKSSV